ncbi:MAG: hypothetical protein QXV44_00490 [Candidatus Anstonellaceae archaeon]
MVISLASDKLKKMFRIPIRKIKKLRMITPGIALTITSSVVLRK